MALASAQISTLADQGPTNGLGARSALPVLSVSNLSKSFGGAKAMGPKAWRILRFVGMNYILIAFARDFVLPVLHPKPAQHTVAHFLAYAPFAILSVAAPSLVLLTSAGRPAALKPEAGT